jgi:hypothetical protein
LCKHSQAFLGFGLVTGNKLIVGCQSGFAGRRQVHFMDQLPRFALNAFRHFIQNIGGLMDPTTLLGDWTVSFMQSNPEA